MTRVNGSAMTAATTLLLAAGLAACGSAPQPTTSAAGPALPPPSSTPSEPATPAATTASTRTSAGDRSIDPSSLATFDALLLEAPTSRSAREVAYDTASAVQGDRYDNRPAARGGEPSVVTTWGELPGARFDAARAASPAGGLESLQQVSFSVEGADFDPVVSRDGNRLVYASTQHAPTADVYIKDVDASTVTQVTSDPANDVMPAIATDGERVAFASDRNGSWDIFITSLSGGQPIQITDDTTHELHPSFSPDGRHVVFSRLGSTSDRWELWVVDVARPARRTFIGYGLFPVWSPSGDKIAFQRSRARGDRLFSVWTLDYVADEGVNPTEIFSSPDHAAVNPAWSPDGARLAFSLIPAEDAERGSRPDVADLYICNVDGADRANLTGGRYSNLSPTWGRDQRIYFVSNRGGTDNIWSLTPARAIHAADLGRAGDTGVAEVDPDSE